MKRAVALLMAAAASLSAFANQANSMLMALPDEKRAVALTRLLQASNEKCPTVTRTFYQGADKRGNGFWNASCTSGKSFVVMVNNDASGSTKIMDCELLKKMNAGTCFKKF